MMVKMDEISSIKTFFLSHSVQLSTAWLEGCISWCKEENLPANYTLKDLQHKIFEQWLLLDLRDVEVPCLPPDLANKTKYILTGNYSLQIMKIIDISKPKHWQLQRIRNTVSKNAEAEVESSKRVLQLTLTDGVQEVEAMEYKPVSCLNLNLSPGIKIRLMGPITIRRGRLMLENQNVKILGGEVEDLIVPNAAENVLATFLKLPLNPTPNVIEESLLTANKDMFNDTGDNTSSNQNANNTRNNAVTASNTVNRNINNTINVPNIINSNKIESARRTNVGNTINVPNLVNRSISISNSNEIQSTRGHDSVYSSTSYHDDQIPDENEEEEMRIAAEIETMMEIEKDFEQPPAKKAKGRSGTPDMFDDDLNDAVFENIDIPPVPTKVTEEENKTEIVDKPLASHSKKEEPDTSDINKQIASHSKSEEFDTSEFNKSLELANDLFENFDIDAHLDEAMKASCSKSSTPKKPIVLPIEKLLINLPHIGNGKFKIRAKFKSVVEKLTFVDDEYYLVIRVEDGTGELNVRLHSDVVSNMADAAPATLLRLKQDIMNNDVDAQRKVLQALGRIKDNLVQLNNIVEVKVNMKEKVPVIVQIVD